MSKQQSTVDHLLILSFLIYPLTISLSSSFQTLINLYHNKTGRFPIFFNLQNEVWEGRTSVIFLFNPKLLLSPVSTPYKSKLCTQEMPDSRYLVSALPQGTSHVMGLLQLFSWCLGKQGPKLKMWQMVLVVDEIKPQPCSAEPCRNLTCLCTLEKSKLNVFSLKLHSGTSPVLLAV